MNTAVTQYQYSKSYPLFLSEVSSNVNIHNMHTTESEKWNSLVDVS